MGHVGDGHQGLMKLRFDLLDGFFAQGYLFLERFPFRDQFLAFGRVAFLGNRFGVFVGLLLQELSLRHERLALVVELHDAIDVGGHIAVKTIGLHSGEIVTNESSIEHGTAHREKDWVAD